MDKDARSGSGSQPTEVQYQAFVELFEHFNHGLFSGRLPQPMLVFSRRKMVHGHYVPGAWRGERDLADEISLNPDRFMDTDPDDFASTLVHEMCHQYQHHFGRPGRGAYHNAEFADLMEARGLVTTSTGGEGGARTGQRIDHLIVEGGRFAVAFQEVGARAFLPFQCLTSDAVPGRQRPGATKTKYSFGSGRRGVWGAPGLVLIDGRSGELLTPEVTGDGEGLEPSGVSRKWQLVQAVAGLSEEEAEQALEILTTAGVLQG